jgi:hypothetical protein
VIVVDVVDVVLVVKVVVVLVVRVVTLVVVLVVVSPQSGGTGFVAALHAAASALLTSLHVFVQGLSLPQAALHVLNSLAMSFLQSFLHAPWAGETVSAAPMSSTANPANHSTPAFMMDLGPEHRPSAGSASRTFDSQVSAATEDGRGQSPVEANRSNRQMIRSRAAPHRADATAVGLTAEVRSGAIDVHDVRG